MDKIKAYGAHALAYAFGALTVVAGLDPTLFAGNPKIVAAIGVAGLLLTGAHNLQAAGAPKAGAVTTVAKVLAMFAVSVVLASSLVACKTAPGVKEQTAVVIAVNIAATRAIQRDDHDMATWQSRATQYKTIAVRLQAVNDAGTATIATLAVELAPLVAKLSPGDQIAANTLVAALTPYLQDQANTSGDLAHVQEHVAVLLEAVIRACEAYGA